MKGETHMYGTYDTPQLQDQLQRLLMPQLQQPQQASVHVTKVNGRAGAEAFNMPPNSDGILLDQNDPIAWFVMTDGAGYKTITPYDLIPHKEKSQNDVIKSMEDRITKLEEAMKHGKPNFRSDYSKPARAEQQRNDAGSRSNDQG